MKMFKYEGFEVKVTPEALVLKPFKKIWDRDKTKTKERAMNELAFLYFFCDVRSDYQYISDDESRMEAVIEGVGLPNGWAPDPLLEKAITFYKSFDTKASILLKVVSDAVDKVQDIVKELAPSDTKSLKDYLTALKLIPEVATMIHDTEKALNEDSDYGEAKGSIEKTLFDDGLDEVAEWTNQQK